MITVWRLGYRDRAYALPLASHSAINLKKRELTVLYVVLSQSKISEAQKRGNPHPSGVMNGGWKP